MADRIADFDAFRGLLIPDPRITDIDSTASSISQAGPRPGIAEAQQDSEMVLVTSGDQAAAAQLRVKAQKPGMPGSKDQFAGVIWQEEGDSYWRGWDAPQAITASEIIVEYEVGVTASLPLHPHLLTRDASGTVIMAYTTFRSVGTTDTVRTRTYDPATRTWASAVTVETITDYSGSQIEAYPCLVALPSGRTLLFHWVEMPSGDFQVRMHYSDDDGATWSTGSDYALREAVTYGASALGDTQAVGRIRAAYNNGEILMMGEIRDAFTSGADDTVQTCLIQWASRDLGASFSEVDRSVPSDSSSDWCGGYPDVVAFGNGFVVAYAHADPGADNWGTNPNYLYDADLNPVSVVLASAYTSWQSETINQVNTRDACTIAATSGSGSYVSDGDLSLLVDDQGVLYLLQRQPQGTYASGAGNFETILNSCLISRSFDGETWEMLGQSQSGSYSTWWNHVDLPIVSGTPSAYSTYPYRIAATFTRGRIMVAHQWVDTAGGYTGSLGALYLGGYTTVPLPSYVEYYDSAQRLGFDYTWLPFDLPDVGIYSSSGAGTAALTSSSVNISTSSNSLLYDFAFVGTIAEGAIVRGILDTTTSTTASNAALCRVRLADGSNEYEVLIRFGQTGIVVRDPHASSGSGAQIGSAVTIDVTAGVEFFVAIKTAAVVTYFRARSTVEDREWTVGPTTTTLTDASTYTTAASANRLRWGHASSTAESDWNFIGLVSDQYTGQHMTGATYPDDLPPRHIPNDSTYIDGGTYIRAIDGPAYQGHEWDIDTRYDYEYHRFLPLKFGSPRISWRTTGSDPTSQVSQQTINFDFDETLTAESAMGNVVMAVGFFGCTGVRTGSIRSRASGGGYTTVTTFDSAKGMNTLDFVLSGNSVTPGSSSTDKPYLYTNEAAGWEIDLGSNKIRTVEWSGEGKWDQGAGKRARLILSDADGTESTSGDAALIPSDFVILWRPDNDTYRSIQIILDAQYTSTGYMEIGTLVVGFVEVFGKQYSRGRTVTTEANYDREIARDGIDRVRQNGPEQRTVEFSWAEDPINMMEAQGAEPTPDWVTTSTTALTMPAATWGDTPMQVEGILRLTNGARVPIVYLPNIAKGSSGNDVQTINRRHDLILGRITGAARIENVLGNESVDEAARIGTITIEELI
jgi:hypothetical protein